MHIGTLFPFNIFQSFAKSSANKETAIWDNFVPAFYNGIRLDFLTCLMMDYWEGKTDVCLVMDFTKKELIGVGFFVFEFDWEGVFE